jgi:hypothetical protein
MGTRQQPQATGFVLFDVIYEDGTQSSNPQGPSHRARWSTVTCPHFRGDPGSQHRPEVRQTKRAH